MTVRREVRDWLICDIGDGLWKAINSAGEEVLAHSEDRLLHLVGKLDS